MLEELQEKVENGQNFSQSERAVISSAENYQKAVSETDSLLDAHFERKIQISKDRENMAFQETQRHAAEMHDESKAKAAKEIMNSPLAIGLLAFGIFLIM